MDRITLHISGPSDDEEPVLFDNTPPPIMASLRGLAPDATGAMLSEDFIRKIRDEWDQAESQQ
jgi:hypothetical protein